MGEAARRHLDYDDLLAADTPAGARPELIGGRVVYKASPRAPHSRAQARLAGHLFAFDHDGADGWWLLTEQDVRFAAHDVVRPDVAGWRRSRLRDLPASGPIDVVPDWACEILSPGHHAHDTKTKRELYRAHGVGWLWLVDPEARTVEAFALRDLAGSSGWLWLGTWTDGDVARIAPFDEVELDVGDLFVPRP